MQYGCWICNEPVGETTKSILEEGAKVICANCSQLPIFANTLVLDDALTSVYGTDAFDQQMASELEGSFFITEWRSQ